MGEDFNVIGWVVVAVLALGTIIAILCSVLRKYTINFNTKEVEFEGLDAIKARKGAKIELPTLTSRNYDFLGWFYDEACTQKADLSKMVDKNLTLYAGWKKKKKDSQIPQMGSYTDYIMHNISFNIALDW
ncbi:MAG: InlB B-repeat-containing protein [Clostridia bacterium]|nr:InlB B-repeat-containing protein [Clostridia bacterium]